MLVGFITFTQSVDKGGLVMKYVRLLSVAFFIAASQLFILQGAIAAVVAVQPDGKIIARSIRGEYSSEGDLVLVRFNPDHSEDPDFGADGDLLLGDASL